MSEIHIRIAKIEDSEGIFELFIKQFPFLKEDIKGTYKDVEYRITNKDSLTVIASVGDAIVAVARGNKEKNDVYVMNSICTTKEGSLLQRTRIMLKLIPFYIDACIDHADALGSQKAFFSTESKSLVKLARKICHQKKVSIELGEYNDENGFWMNKK